MKFGKWIGALALASASMGNAQAETYDFSQIVASNTTFNDVVIGTFTLGSGYWNVTGSVVSQLQSNSGFGPTWYFRVASPLTGTLSTNMVDYNPAPTAFDYRNLTAGTYNVLASGKVNAAGGNPAYPFALITSQVDSTTPVPEPAPIALAGMGLAVLLLRRKRRAARANG